MCVCVLFNWMNRIESTSSQFWFLTECPLFSGIVGHFRLFLFKSLFRFLTTLFFINFVFFFKKEESNWFFDFMICMTVNIVLSSYSFSITRHTHTLVTRMMKNDCTKCEDRECDIMDMDVWCFYVDVEDVWMKPNARWQKFGIIACE